jgi:hypothetical protein
MAIPQPPQSSAYPPAPQRGEQESVFVPKANALVASLEPRRQDLQNLADYTYARAVDAEGFAAAASGSAADAQTAQGAAETAQGLAEGARDAAQTAESGAVAAKDTAEGIIGVAGAFADTASGLAGTTDGEYFALSTDGSVWLNNAGVAEQVTDYSTLADAIGMISAALDAINGEVV